MFFSVFAVALLAEGVDRNSICARRVRVAASVALLAEGVDRNVEPGRLVAPIRASPSSRRAWIEIDHVVDGLVQAVVALLAEGVDRNF